ALFSDSPSDAWAWLAAVVVAVVVSWWAEKHLVAVGFTIGFDLLTGVEERVRERLEAIRPDWFDANRRAEVQQTLVSAGHELCTSFVYVVTPAVSAVGSTLLVSLGLFWLDPLLGAIALCGWLLVAAVLAIGGRLLRSADASFASASNEAGSRIVEFTRSQRLLRASGRMSAAESELGAALSRQRRAALGLVGWTVPGNLLFTLAYQLMLVGLVAATVSLFIDGAVSTGEAVALAVVFVRLLEPFVTLAELAPAVELLQAALRRIRRFLDAPTLAEPEQSAEPDATAPVLELRGVRFAYPGGPVVLDGIDLVVPRGSTTAIVGPSGSGKSTLLDLAARAMDVDEGVILHEGADVREVRLDDLLARTAMVHQDTYLFDGSLRDNVLAGRPDATDDELRSACTAAQLDDVIERLPDGWHSRVGEDGARLSGGERQRVSIARAIVRRAPLLLLDEATSALDVRAERGLVRALDDGADDRTIVVVAHRLSTIARADHIAFLEDGVIVERGTLAELLDLGGRFADYWRMREEAGAWTLTP
ncbi:MAG TPA: ABC transporter ATP-binding protein, partial [Nocardioidaceae bacterium]|nr:ABC transporter ATP-binding protein [Nocardioidaceae bacterium]